jgi:hypothetical protein
MIDLDGADSIASVARRVCLSGQSAVLCAEVPGDVGYLFFLNGALIHATSLDLTGDTAAAEILRWQSASLSWCERRWPRDRSVTQSLDELLQQAPDNAAAVAGQREDEPPESEARRAQPTDQVTPAPRLPSATGVARALLGDGFKNALSVDGSGLVSGTRGSHEHLKAVARSSALLGDLFGEALGVGPLIAAEASSSGLQRIIARSSGGSAAAETSGGNALHLARAFLKL